MSDFWGGKRVLFTGGAGFLGQALAPRLRALGAQVEVPRRASCDLRDLEQVERLYRTVAPQLVIHAAVHGGGIGYMRAHPAEVYYDNVMMNTLMVEGARRHRVEKFVGVGTICSYPKFASIPFREEELWNGYPEETNGPYGVAKKMMLVQTEAYRQQYGLNGIHVLMVNLYGPADDFHPESSHVIPALIRKFSSAAASDQQAVEVWGTGTATREFLYVDDAAEGIQLAAERYNHGEPVNLGSGIEVPIKELVELIARITEFRGRIVWDTSKPDGQPRRCLDVSKAKQEFGFKARTLLEDGLRKTVAYYRQVYGDLSIAPVLTGRASS